MSIFNLEKQRCLLSDAEYQRLKQSIVAKEPCRDRIRGCMIGRLLAMLWVGRLSSGESGRSSTKTAPAVSKNMI